MSVPLGSPQYTSELGRLSVKSCTVYLCPTSGESRYGAYVMCHPVFLEPVKDPAVLLIWSSLRPSTAHQFCLIYIPECTLYFYVRNQWEKRSLSSFWHCKKKTSPKKKKKVMYIMHSVNIFSACFFMREFF